MWLIGDAHTRPGAEKNGDVSVVSVHVPVGVWGSQVALGPS